MKASHIFQVAAIIVAITTGFAHGFTTVAQPILYVGYGAAAAFMLVGLILARHERQAERMPELSLDYSADYARAHHTELSGLFVCNSRKNDAVTVRLEGKPVGRYRLEFEDMPIQRIGADQKAPVKVWTQELNNGRWGRTGLTLGMQIEGCFERMGYSAGLDRIPITITCQGKRKHWIIRRGEWPTDHNHIWCEPA